jgi:hypothetical protein
VVGVQQALQAQKTVKPVLPLYVDKSRLAYTPDALGNRIPDFSFCGYKASEKPIPNVAVKIVVPLSKGNATKRIQAALDCVAALPQDENGFRGAVLLQNGTYEIYGQLRITAPGVVLRGSGMLPGGTVLYGAGTGRQAMIKIIGANTIHRDLPGLKITDAYVPVNAMSFNVDSTISLKEYSNKIIIRRPSTQKWISILGTDVFGGGISALGWKPGDRDLFFDRTITKIEGTTISIDAPITTALDSAFGSATLLFYSNDGRVNNAGIENICFVSTYNKSNPKDEDHRWNGINI